VSVPVVFSLMEGSLSGAWGSSLVSVFTYQRCRPPRSTAVSERGETSRPEDTATPAGSAGFEVDRGYDLPSRCTQLLLTPAGGRSGEHRRFGRSSSRDTVSI
jgi:hypothetical protein